LIEDTKESTQVFTTFDEADNGLAYYKVMPNILLMFNLDDPESFAKVRSAAHSIHALPTKFERNLILVGNRRDVTSEKLVLPIESPVITDIRSQK
jgi:hypothetical protein